MYKIVTAYYRTIVTWNVLLWMKMIKPPWNSIRTSCFYSLTSLKYFAFNFCVCYCLFLIRSLHAILFDFPTTQKKKKKMTSFWYIYFFFRRLLKEEKKNFYSIYTISSSVTSHVKSWLFIDFSASESNWHSCQIDNER